MNTLNQIKLAGFVDRAREYGCTEEQVEVLVKEALPMGLVRPALTGLSRMGAWLGRAGTNIMPTIRMSPVGGAAARSGGGWLNSARNAVGGGMQSLGNMIGGRGTMQAAALRQNMAGGFKPSFPDIATDNAYLARMTGRNNVAKNVATGIGSAGAAVGLDRYLNRK